ncbi:hypothetical protein ACP4J4_20200 (plasmid) [Aureimonas ureilytica]|uniref:hypothetical protein n=1 Tax=Aureimonas ureilytica TaxID=401562 RepID=UPI003CF21C63
MGKVGGELRTFLVLEAVEVAKGITAQPDTYAGSEEWSEVTTMKGKSRTPSRFWLHLSEDQIEDSGGAAPAGREQFDVTEHVRNGLIKLVE